MDLTLNAAIVVIGDEILIGQVQDTNSHYLAQKLHLLGVKTDTIIAIHDDAAAIINTVDELLKCHSLVFTTGGLGPTSDDKTKSVLADYFNCSLKTDEKVLNHIQQFFISRNLPMISSNLEQALVPEKAEILFNDLGTAPGLHFKKNESHLFVMPGVPYEMKFIFEHRIVDIIENISSFQKQYSKTIIVANIGESFLSELISPWENLLPKTLTLAYLPSPGLIRLRLSGIAEDNQAIESAFSSLMPYIEPYYVSNKDLPLSEILGELLLENNFTVASAESCTGGLIGHLITEIPGSSQYYKGSVIAYSNEIKENILKVPAEILQNEGAVSSACVAAMAENICTLFQCNMGIAVSGIAGPGGATPQKEVGTVFVAIHLSGKTETFEFHFGKNRSINILRAANAALVQSIHTLRQNKK